MVEQNRRNSGLFRGLLRPPSRYATTWLLCCIFFVGTEKSAILSQCVRSGPGNEDRLKIWWSWDAKMPNYFLPSPYVKDAVKWYEKNHRRIIGRIKDRNLFFIGIIEAIYYRKQVVCQALYNPLSGKRQSRGKCHRIQFFQKDIVARKGAKALRFFLLSFAVFVTLRENLGNDRSL